MEVILLEQIRNLGTVGDKVKVKAGFARNFLIPYQKAVPANEANLKAFETRRAELEKAAADNLKAAEERAKQVASLEVSIPAKASDEGKLFGSIGAREVAEAVVAAGHEIQKSEVVLPEGPMRSVGEFDIDLQLHSDVVVAIKVKVVAEA